MNIFFDTEFTGLHKNTTLISIGLVDDQDKTFYAEFTDYDKHQCEPWIKRNVINNLKWAGTKSPERIKVENDKGIAILGDTQYIANHLLKWLTQYQEVQLVSDVCHYDMILFINIFGHAFDVPGLVAPCCHDINQDIARYFNIRESKAFDLSREGILENFNIKIDGDKHNALYDAKVIKAIYNEIIEHE